MLDCRIMSYRNFIRYGSSWSPFLQSIKGDIHIYRNKLILVLLKALGLTKVIEGRSVNRFLMQWAVNMLRRISVRKPTFLNMIFEKWPHAVVC